MKLLSPFNDDHGVWRQQAGCPQGIQDIRQLHLVASMSFDGHAIWSVLLKKPRLYGSESPAAEEAVLALSGPPLVLAPSGHLACFGSFFAMGPA